MKKTIFKIAFLISLFAVCAFNTIVTNNSTIEKKVRLESKYEEGWKDGFCEGWKEEKGKNAYCPYAPYAPYPKYPKVSTSYRDGYNDGFLRGICDARK